MHPHTCANTGHRHGPARRAQQQQQRQRASIPRRRLPVLHCWRERRRVFFHPPPTSLGASTSEGRTSRKQSQPGITLHPTAMEEIPYVPISGWTRGLGPCRSKLWMDTSLSCPRQHHPTAKYTPPILLHPPPQPNTTTGRPSSSSCSGRRTGRRCASWWPPTTTSATWCVPFYYVLVCLRVGALTSLTVTSTPQSSTGARPGPWEGLVRGARGDLHPG